MTKPPSNRNAETNLETVVAEAIEKATLHDPDLHHHYVHALQAEAAIAAMRKWDSRYAQLGLREAYEAYYPPEQNTEIAPLFYEMCFATFQAGAAWQSSRTAQQPPAHDALRDAVTALRREYDKLLDETGLEGVIYQEDWRDLDMAVMNVESILLNPPFTTQASASVSDSSEAGKGAGDE